jgi:hypothetical protein
MTDCTVKQMQPITDQTKIKIPKNVRTTKIPKLTETLPTGGELNILNEKSRCNSRRNSVPVMELVRKHRPANPEILRILIAKHQKKCKCGIKSMGTVEQFATNLYNAQFGELGQTMKKRYSWDECYLFQYSLFCVGPLRGQAMENASKYEFVRAIDQCGKELICREATIEEDFDFAVDLVVFDSKSKKNVLGIQVKSRSAMRRNYVIRKNKAKQSRFGCPVIFHVYSYEGKFTPDAKKVILHL